MIVSFSGEYRFLSNFWPCKVSYEGQEYDSVEHAYQAAKTWPEYRDKFLVVTASKAKELGKRVAIRPDFDKLAVMEELLRQKFTREPLKSKLLETEGDIIEGNTWGDIFWGECPLGNGQNHLGRILMNIREELKSVNSRTRR